MWVWKELGSPWSAAPIKKEARWIKKRGHAYYGYRGCSAVDTEDGYVEHIEVHPATEAEANKLPAILDQLPKEIDAILADKGDASAANRQALQDRGIGDRIQHKASRGHPLHLAYTRLNKP